MGVHGTADDDKRFSISDFFVSASPMGERRVIFGSLMAGAVVSGLEANTPTITW